MRLKKQRLWMIMKKSTKSITTAAVDEDHVRKVYKKLAQRGQYVVVSGNMRSVKIDRAEEAAAA